MSWFVFALLCLLGWGFADLFYKKSSDEKDPYSHLKLAVWVGLVMGTASFILLPSSETLSQEGPLLSRVFTAALKYAPASLGYIISMVIGYAGLRYLELSVVSPVQNASGALSALFMLIWFLLTGHIQSITDEYSVLDLIGTLLVVSGVIALAVAEKKLADRESAALPDEQKPSGKYRTGALALIFPLLYCLFDTIGTAADGIILDEESRLGLGEIDILVLYGLTFFLAGILAWIFLWVRIGKPYNPFRKAEASKGIAALCEEFGQVFYIYAMARDPVIAAPMVASYCIVSVLLSRLCLKENIGRERYICIFAVILGIILLGISEGLGEA